LILIGSAGTYLRVELAGSALRPEGSAELPRFAGLRSQRETEHGADGVSRYTLVLLALALGAWAIFLFNRLVKARNRVRAGWGDIDVQLKRRHDLIPRLVEAVGQYARYEQATLTAVTELRARSERAARIAEIGAAETALQAQLGRLIALAEAYPDLKASERFMDLQHNLVDVEDHIQYARRYYNGAVRDLNTRVESFPDLLIARLFRFRQADYFQLDAESDAKVPEVVLR
jgi:LemA protein